MYEDPRPNVFEVSYDSKTMKQVHGLYSTKEKALRYLMMLGVYKIKFVMGEKTFMEGDYVIEERIVS